MLSPRLPKTLKKLLSITVPPLPVLFAAKQKDNGHLSLFITRHFERFFPSVYIDESKNKKVESFPKNFMFFGIFKHFTLYISTIVEILSIAYRFIR